MHISKKDLSFLNLAKKVAIKNCKRNSKWMFGSVIVSSGRVLSIGVNKTYKTHTYQLNATLKAHSCNKSEFLVDRLHAEVDCIKNLKGKVPSNSVIYVSRADCNPSMPCRICLYQIKRSGIRSIVYRSPTRPTMVKL